MTYFLDFRKQVLKSLERGMTFEQAAREYDISPTTIQKWKQCLHSKKTRNTRPTKISNDALLKDVETHPDSYHYERARRLNCSSTGIFHALKRLGISQKKTLAHSNACPIKRAEFNAKLHYFKKQGFPIIYLDESGFEMDTIRPYGYAPIGKPCIDSHNWQIRKRTHVIGALYNKTLFALDCFKQNINSTLFYDWCKQTLIPSLTNKCVIVMDNARFHKSKRIQKLLNRHGHRILWLPPYSPDLNPSENKWAQAKFVRQGWLENNLPKLSYDMGCIDFIRI